MLDFSSKCLFSDGLNDSFFHFYASMKLIRCKYMSIIDKIDKEDNYDEVFPNSYMDDIIATYS